ncbi:hypothetical protein COCCADRAFT_84105 [Bipolaris zeicola 26-R-13]|uniref:Uncharacterized protein n=1 Tax=Cochliobolus carbonum (strain 26-R-13) TaxID=930089 RepID=W6YK19_COCC2|nr:uncharacterized protein COCCADRAFT_84105 [Bipolaris zeicola 26-R-13]EUC38013.1 hypothetical protein COCCADRAFT_84105 [Bipolaris zeicola 26-R-13]
MRDFLDVFFSLSFLSINLVFIHRYTFYSHVLFFLFFLLVGKTRLQAFWADRVCMMWRRLGPCTHPPPGTGYSWRKTWHIPMIGSVWKLKRELSLSLLHLQ